MALCGLVILLSTNSRGHSIQVLHTLKRLPNNGLLVLVADTADCWYQLLALL